MSVELERRVAAVMSRPPLREAAPAQLRELGEEARAAGSFEDLPGKWQAAILQAEGDGEGESPHSCH